MKAKKSLGQNFLKSKHAVRVIVESAHITPGETIIEVGPGKGVLTRALLDAGARVIAIEKDDDLIGPIQEMFSSDIGSGALTVIHGDVMKLTIDDILKKGEPTTTEYKVVANIPYYITGALIRMFLEAPRQPSAMVLMLQKEVARRITASDGKESLLSLSVKAYGTPRYIETVKAMFFSPRPKVDSAILLISHISKDFFDTCTEEQFFNTLKAGFTHKRKVLVRNLETLHTKEKITEAFTSRDLSLRSRAEDISLEDWKHLASFL